MKSATIYKRGEAFHFQSDSKTTAGVWLATEPFLRLESKCTSQDKAKAVLEVLAASQESIPHPVPPVSRFHRMLELAQVQSWAQFVKGARCVSVRMDNQGISIKPYRNAGARYGFKDMSDQIIKLPLTAAADELGNAIDDALERCL